MSDQNTNEELEEKVIDMLRTVYDPEIPVDIYELGLVYEINFRENNEVSILITLTAPNCPASDMIVSDIEKNVGSIEEISKVHVEITFEPAWEQDMMSEVAKLQLGFM